MATCNPSDRKIKIYLLNGLIIVDKGNGIFFGPASPENFLPSYIDSEFFYNDRVTLQYGNNGFTDVSPDRICAQDGTPVGDIDDVRAYFISLGIGQTSGGTGNVQSVNGIEPVDGDITLPLPFVTLTQFDALVSRVTALEQAAGYTQLDTPVVTASEITQTAATIQWASIPNADSYDIKDADNDLVANIATLNYTFAGLTLGTQYTYYVIAKGSGNYLDSNAGIISFTTQGKAPPSQPQLKPSFQLTPSTALY